MRPCADHDSVAKLVRLPEMLDRYRLKSALQQVGLFPIVRSAYRALNSSVRAQQSHEIMFYQALLKPNSLCFDVGLTWAKRLKSFVLAEPG
jgi:hypothetical protein